MNGKSLGTHGEKYDHINVVSVGETLDSLDESPPESVQGVLTWWLQRASSHLAVTMLSLIVEFSSLVSPMRSSALNSVRWTSTAVREI